MEKRNSGKARKMPLNTSCITLQKQVPSQHRIPLHLIQSRLQRATSRRSASHLEDPVAQGTAGITSPSDQPFLDTLLMEVMTTGQAHHSSCVLRCVLRCVCVVAAHLLMTNGTGFHVTGRDFFQKCVHGIGLQLQRLQFPKRSMAVFFGAVFVGGSNERIDLEGYGFARFGPEIYMPNVSIQNIMKRTQKSSFKATLLFHSVSPAQTMGI